MQAKLCAVLLGCAAPTAMAAAAPPAWTPYRDEAGLAFCGASQAERPGQADVNLTLWRHEGAVWMDVMNPATEVVRKAEVKLELKLDDGAPVAVTGRGHQPSAFRKGFTIRIDDALLSGLAKARHLRLLRDGREVALVDLAGSAAAVAGARTCMSEVEAKWAALPPAPFAPPAPPPPPPPKRSWPSGPLPLYAYVSPDDYPALALKEGAQGNVTMALGIDAKGRVESCSVTSSSGNTELDYGSCLVAERRFFFYPALDSAGQPTRGTITRKLGWRLPEEKEGDALVPARQ